MQFRDLKTQYQVLKKDIDQAMIDVAASSAYINGPQVAQFEKELADAGIETDAVSPKLLPDYARRG